MKRMVLKDVVKQKLPSEMTDEERAKEDEKYRKKEEAAAAAAAAAKAKESEKDKYHRLKREDIAKYGETFAVQRDSNGVWSYQGRVLKYGNGADTIVDLALALGRLERSGKPMLISNGIGWRGDLRYETGSRPTPYTNGADWIKERAERCGEWKKDSAKEHGEQAE